MKYKKVKKKHVLSTDENYKYFSDKIQETYYKNTEKPESIVYSIKNTKYTEQEINNFNNKKNEAVKLNKFFDDIKSLVELSILESESENNPTLKNDIIIKKQEIINKYDIYQDIVNRDLTQEEKTGVEKILLFMNYNLFDCIRFSDNYTKDFISTADLLSSFNEIDRRFYKLSVSNRYNILKYDIDTSGFYLLLNDIHIFIPFLFDNLMKSFVYKFLNGYDFQISNK